MSSPRTSRALNLYHWPCLARLQRDRQTRDCDRSLPSGGFDALRLLDTLTVTAAIPTLVAHLTFSASPSNSYQVDIFWPKTVSD